MKSYLTHPTKRQSIDENILSKDDSKISKVLLFGDNSSNEVRNTSVLTAQIELIILENRFYVSLYQN